VGGYRIRKETGSKRERMGRKRKKVQPDSKRAPIKPKERKGQQRHGSGSCSFARAEPSKPRRDELAEKSKKKENQSLHNAIEQQQGMRLAAQDWTLFEGMKAAPVPCQKKGPPGGKKLKSTTAGSNKERTRGGRTGYGGLNISLTAIKTGSPR